MMLKRSAKICRAFFRLNICCLGRLIMVIAKDRDFLKYLIIVSIVLLVFLLKDSRHQGLANTQNVSKLKLDGVELNILIRKTLLTLNDANLTGNYTVLRDLSAPEFQKQFNAARLSETFADLRKRKLDLSPIVLFHPKLTRKPEFKGKNIIRLTGYIPTKPEQVNFDIFFQRNSNRWLLIGLSVNTKKTNNVSARKPKRNIKKPQ